MTSYITIANTEVDPDSPITADLMTKLRDNPIAISEGSSGAPKVSKLALGGLLLGVSAASGTSWSGITSIGTVSEIFVNWSITSGTGSTIVAEVRFSNDNGTTWGSAQTLLTVSPTGTASLPNQATGSANINLVSGARSASGSFLHTRIVSGASTNVPDSATNVTALTVPANCNGVQFRSNSGSSAAIACTILGVSGR